MSQTLTREIRPLLPIVAVTALVSVAPFFLSWPSGLDPIFSFILVVACWCLMGASVFGREFSERTMSLLLSQPVSRRQIWWQKMAVLGAGLFVSTVVLTLCRQFLKDGFPSDAKPTLVVGFLCAFCTAPYLALVTRQTTGAVVFSVLIPFVIILLVNLVVLCFLSPQALGAPYTSNRLIDPLLALALILYCGVCFRLGYRRFLRLQVIDSQSLELNLPRRLEAALDRMFAGRHGTYVSLLLKELRLQRVTFLTALIFCVVVLLEFAVKAVYPGMDGIYLVSTVVIYVVMLPIVSGAVSVAEEREWGTAQWQLTLPTSTRRQWAMKTFVTLSLASVLGLFLPIAFRVLSPFKDFSLKLSDLEPNQVTLTMVLVFLIYTSVAIYASSLSTNTLRAVLTTLCALLAAGSVIYLAGQVGDVYDSFPFNLLGSLSLTSQSPAGLFAGFLALLGLILVLGWFNFRKAEPHQNWLVLQCLVILTGFFCLAAGLFYDANRVRVPPPFPLATRAHPAVANQPGMQGGANYRQVQPATRVQLQPGLPKKEDQ